MNVAGSENTASVVPNRSKALGILFSSFVILFSSLYLSSVDCRAQDDQNDSPPPPLRLISKDEKTQLSGEHDVKSRTKVAIELMNSRLAAAEKLQGAGDFAGMSRELGAFEGLLDDHLEFLIKNDNDSGRVLDNFKRFEIGLRSFMPRIETIRRDLPPKYEPYVRSVGKYIRDARTRALEPLFSDTVVREPKKPD